MQQRFPASSRRPLHPSTPTRLDSWVSLNNGWMLAKDADWYTRVLELYYFVGQVLALIWRWWCWLVFDTEGGLYPLGVNKTLLISRLLIILRKTLTIHFPDMVRFILVLYSAIIPHNYNSTLPGRSFPAITYSSGPSMAITEEILFGATDPNIFLVFKLCPLRFGSAFHWLMFSWDVAINIFPMERTIISRARKE